jgi:dUTP pyrophosphatase
MGSVLSQQDIENGIKASPPLVEGYLDLVSQLQTNGFDLTLRDIRALASCGQVALDNRERILSELKPLEYGPDGFIHLAPGAYNITFNEVVNLSKNVMALGRPRSSLLRCGASLHTAIWDAGYSGRSESLLVVYNPLGLNLKRNAKVLQLVFMQLTQMSQGYQGRYQGENLG